MAGQGYAVENALEAVMEAVSDRPGKGGDERSGAGRG